MRELIGRRDVVRLAGLAGLGAVLGGCAGPAPDPTPNASGSAARPSPAPGPASGSGTPTYSQLEKQLTGSLSRPGQKGFRPKSLLYNPRFFSQRPPEAIARVANSDDVAACVRFAADGGAPLVRRLRGALAEVAVEATAFPWRTALADVQYTATWPYAHAGRDPTPFDDFVQSERRALQSWVGTSAYANYTDRTLIDYATAYWGENLPRLSGIKKRCDPYDVFAFPQSVPLP